MIIQTLVGLTFLGALNCHPYPQNIKLPALDLSRPEEVNSLERAESFERSIDPQKIKSNNIEDTVKEVEELIKSNPALPRLTRGEILDLLENITSLDQQKNEFLGKNRNPKAVMVVMPYTPTNDKNMEDLYTKAPVTQIIGAEPFQTKEDANKGKHSRRRPPVQFNDTDNDLANKPLPTEEKKKYSASINDNFIKHTPSRTQIRRKRPEATTEAMPTTYHPTTPQHNTRRPVRRRTTISTTPHPNHRYTDEYVPNQGLKIIEPPKLATPDPPKVHFLPDLDLQENVKQEVVVRHDPPMSASIVTLKPNFEKMSTTTKAPTTETLIEEINLPNNLKTVMKDLNLQDGVDPNIDELNAKLEEQNKLKDLLASIGIVPQMITTTTTTAMPNAESVAESLSPEMRDLLMSFGLLPNPNEKPVEHISDKYYPDQAEVKPESYIGFKPLPDDGPSRDDMDALLASFGLGRSARKAKSAKATTNPDKETLSFDMIPEHLRSVVDDLGISQSMRQEKRIRTPTVEKTVEKQHVFSPDTQYATEEELKKLEKLISMIKQLEKMNGTATEEDLKKFDLEGLRELVTSLNSSSNESLVTLDQKDNSPDPTTFDVGVEKNEVKRQESTSTSTSSSTTTSESPTTIATSSESETPNLKDLEASFGGQTEAITLPPVPELTTSKSGFYYLVDWNTFLDIDDTKGRRVNLRFQPTIGDPKRFLSVSVP